MRGRLHKQFILFLVISLTTVIGPALAKESDGGTHSQEEIKKACNAVGGDLLGVSDLGSYGCENHKTGTMILCNKNQKCTVFSEARSKKDGRKILGTFSLKEAALKGK